MAEQELDRNEQATPFKLEQARKKGSVAKSQDAVYVAVLCALVIFLYSFGWQAINRFLSVAQITLGHAGRNDWSQGGVVAWLCAALLACLQPFLPLLLALMIAAILASLAQTGPVFSTHPIKPDFNRLNPAAGFKRLFSIKVIYEGFKSVVKLTLIGIVLTLALSELLPLFMALPNMDARHYAAVLLDTSAALLFKLALVALILAILDMAYTRWEFGRQMRMSARELKEEHKQREGDPRIRARLRELRMEVLKRTQGVARVAEADVLITNPVHFAIAVKYKHGEMAAPLVIAKGAGKLAAKLREAAYRHDVVVVQNPPLARALFKQVDSDQYVPESLYPDVAKILVWIYAMRAARTQGAA
ncbi:flagellar biosynthesis protein FlhB [Chitinimonas sp. BJB300]|uniref:flagellar biosynthesis protein FlhB n=1 Tax=Chitinimonas sp. BJB300 TaxID=1559339 RepID=UPI000C0F24B2|nr:flagellar biosynthesis protein FlhB [Chitinimonas sp. BJB300]PHV12883.1 flagellar biosynthesis protein FlhB [Chitinimonas sp. BJB300]TSJ86084.1 flagellar biosynthesis protein FlhB [Chitinimonas sp. BJB300]